MFSSPYDVIVIKFQIKHESNSPLIFFSKMGTGYQIGQISAVFSQNKFISQKKQFSNVPYVFLRFQVKL